MVRRASMAARQHIVTPFFAIDLILITLITTAELIITLGGTFIPMAAVLRCVEIFIIQSGNLFS